MSAADHNALAGIDDPVEWNVAIYELRLAALRAVEELPSSDQLDGLKTSLERVDALLALQPPTEEEQSDGR